MNKWISEYLELEKEIKEMRKKFIEKYCLEHNIPITSEEELADIYALLTIKSYKYKKGVDN